MAFHEVRFPEKISYGAVGGPGFKTTVFTRASGYEDRNVEWAKARAEYDVAHGIKTQAELDQLLAFFYARRAKAYGFRFKDWSDYKSCSATKTPAAADQSLGTGDGTNRVFQLVKTYSDAADSYVRTINKPVSGTVKIAVDGVLKTETTHYTIDYTTGVVTFTVGNAPGSGAAVTAGYEFDVPCRFDTDKMLPQIEDYNVHTWGQIPIVEIRV